MSDHAEPTTGRCYCGAVRYSFPQAPMTVRACWCRDCQYLASGNATVNAIFMAEGFEVTGPLSDYVSTADSGSLMHRRFCTACGTHMFSEAESRPQLVVVRVGTLDDPALGRPQGVIWTGSAPAWGHVFPELPGCTGQPGPVRAD